jgi:predicted dehydrogenase
MIADVASNVQLASRSEHLATRQPSAKSSRPRLGFLGVGWIGRHRMEAVIAESISEVIAIADTSKELTERAQRLAPRAAAARTLEDLLEVELDGIVIATPSALHAVQTRTALEHGVAVFCQKPLARTAAETRSVLRAARAANRLLGVDLSYRHTRAIHCVRELVAGGELGDIYAVDLTFHNAYGPDKPWFRDPILSGGGCVIDLGIHLVDLALWILEFPPVMHVTSRLYARGRLLEARPDIVEDFAVAQLELASGAVARLACSWNLSAGCDAVIEVTFHGTRGAASFRNVNGSFYDFVAEHWVGTHRTLVTEPPDAWGGRAVVAWTRQLAFSCSFDAEVENISEVATVLDRIYGR